MIVNNWFFSVLVSFFLQHVSFSGVGKHQLLRIHFCINISFCDPHIEGMPKTAIRIEFPRSCNSALRKYKVPMFHLGLNRKHSTCTRVFHWTIFGFLPCIKVFIVLKLKKVLFLLIDLDLELMFPGIYRFEDFRHGRSRFFCTCRKEFDWKPIRSDPCIRMLLIRKFQKCYCYWFVPIFELIFLISCILIDTLSLKAILLENILLNVSHLQLLNYRYRQLITDIDNDYHENFLISSAVKLLITSRWETGLEKAS